MAMTGGYYPPGVLGVKCPWLAGLDRRYLALPHNVAFAQATPRGLKACGRLTQKRARHGATLATDRRQSGVHRQQRVGDERAIPLGCVVRLAGCRDKEIRRKDLRALPT